MLTRIIEGDAALLEKLDKKYAAEEVLRQTARAERFERIAAHELRAAQLAEHEAHREPTKKEARKMKRKSRPVDPDQPRRPLPPPILSWDVLKQPFFRFRGSKQKQGMSMTIRARIMQRQKRIDRMANMQWYLMYARKEEEFMASLGISDYGYADELSIGIASLHIDMEETEYRKALRWEDIQAKHREHVIAYNAALAAWKIEMDKWRESKETAAIAQD